MLTLVFIPAIYGLVKARGLPHRSQSGTGAATPSYTQVHLPSRLVGPAAE
jgi:Cu(I)/Ag(I) efflux system membrane protein CusA/SilA